MSTNFDWIRDQLSGASTPEGQASAVLELLTRWDAMEVPEEFREDTLKLFTDLAMGHTLYLPNPDEVWVDARAGDLVIRDIVRVKRDAFTGVLGTVHNGRVGVIVGVRYGDIVVRSTKSPSSTVRGTPRSCFKSVSDNLT
jgi:hypothetical protein